MSSRRVGVRQTQFVTYVSILESPHFRAGKYVNKVQRRKSAPPVASRQTPRSGRNLRSGATPGERCDPVSPSEVRPRVGVRGETPRAFNAQTGRTSFRGDLGRQPLGKRSDPAPPSGARECRPRHADQEMFPRRKNGARNWCCS